MSITITPNDTVINYADSNNWIVRTQNPAKKVDVFYVYPTISSNPTGSMSLKDSTERNLATGIFKAQASVFEPNANLFAPLYRQMSTKVTLPASGLMTDTPEFQQGAKDVIAAFDHYMEKLNQGRPLRQSTELEN